ncbi:MAG TPA: YIP1 family protein [Chthoniobacterales bacterium]|jgi:hypothetical protein
MATIHVNRAGTTLGTFSEEDVRGGLRSGRFLGTDLGWREGMPAWQPLSLFTEFVADLAAAPAPGAAPSPAPAPATPAGGAQPAAIVPSAAMPQPQSVAPGSGLPWDRRGELGLFKAFVETLQMVLGRPADAFTAMKREGGLGEPLLYAVIGGTVGIVAKFVYTFGFQMVGGSFAGSSSHRIFGAAGLLGSIIFSPVLVIIILFLTAGLIHVCLMIVGGARQPFETTFRVICFAAGSAYPLQVVPFCGGLVAGVWALVLYCLGLAKAHETDTGRAVLAVFLPAVICCGGGILLVVLVGGLGALSQAWH